MPFIQGNRARIFAGRVQKPNPGTPINRSHWSAWGLVGLWLCNNGGDKVYDLSGNGNHGALAGDTHYVPGKFDLGSALRFDGSDVVNCGGAGTAIDHAGDLTVVVWFNADAWSTTNFPGIVSKRDAWATMDWSLYYDYNTGTGDLCIQWIGGNGGGVDLFSAIDWDPAVGVWHQCVVTKQGNDYTLYANGVALGTEVDATAMTTGESIRFGTLTGDDTEGFDGDIDHVIFYNRALSAVEVTSLYTDPFQMFF